MPRPWIPPQPIGSSELPMSGVAPPGAEGDVLPEPPFGSVLSVFGEKCPRRRLKTRATSSWNVTLGGGAVRGFPLAAPQEGTPPRKRTRTNAAATPRRWNLAIATPFRSGSPWLPTWRAGDALGEMVRYPVERGSKAKPRRSISCWEKNLPGRYRCRKIEGAKGAITSPLLLIPQSIDQLHAHQALAWALWEQRNPVTDGGRGIGRPQGSTRELRESSPGRSPLHGGNLFRGSEDIFIDVESRSHARSVPLRPARPGMNARATNQPKSRVNPAPWLVSCQGRIDLLI